MPKSRVDAESPRLEVTVPEGPVTEAEVIGGIRRMAHGETADTTKLRAWELLGRVIGLFKESSADGGATVVRLTPPLESALPPEDARREEAGDG